MKHSQIKKLIHSTYYNNNLGNGLYYQFHNYKINTTSNLDLIDILKKFNIFVIIKTKSDFDKKDIKKNSSYICNLNDDKGTHWTSFYIDNNNNMYYSDSFGAEPPQNIRTIKKFKHYFCNTSQIQKVNSTACGYYCILFLLFMNKYKSVEGFNKYINNFNLIDQSLNDDILFKCLNTFEI